MEFKTNVQFFYDIGPEILDSTKACTDLAEWLGVSADEKTLQD